MSDFKLAIKDLNLAHEIDPELSPVIKELKKIKKEYIDTGKAQLIFIDFPLDQIAFNASKLLHCLDKKKQISLVYISYYIKLIYYLIFIFKFKNSLFLVFMKFIIVLLFSFSNIS